LGETRSSCRATASDNWTRRSAAIRRPARERAGPALFEADETISPLPLDAYAEDAVHRGARQVLLRPSGHDLVADIARDYASFDAYSAAHAALLLPGAGF
jgi:hypothetical protein